MAVARCKGMTRYDHRVQRLRIVAGGFFGGLYGTSAETIVVRAETNEAMVLQMFDYLKSLFI